MFLTALRAGNRRERAVGVEGHHKRALEFSNSVRDFGPGMKAAPAVWEFEVHMQDQGNEKDEKEDPESLQPTTYAVVLVEKSYQSFCSGGSRRIEDLPEDPNFDPAPGILLTAFVTEPSARAAVAVADLDDLPQCFMRAAIE
ncbi:hypothetical protein AK812_SmicGene1443 [Symbiodinium microadriaticum]|uniref:Uncharacterized protein n=1 Tax=Symbiodinium microadriaticum TaxID=2951 RepID=A0A1Q9F406_SYMMI|nr:hypothetical protein AK812_SmicGene1443 [Symbiodinium microadriaticum]